MNKQRTLRPIAAAILCALLAASAPAPAAEVVDGILATVDKEVILRSDLMREIAPFVEDLRRTATSQQEFDRTLDTRLSEALDQAVENKILLREALLAGIEVSEEGVEERIQTIRERYPTNEAFLADLDNAGETMSNFRDHVRKQILAISMGMQKRRLFEAEAVVSEAEVRQHYLDNKKEFTRPERVRLRRIFLSVTDDPQQSAQVKLQIEDLARQLDVGTDFAALAKAHSEGPEADNGGLMGWVARGDLVNELETAAFALAPGQTSPPVHTEFGYHLLRVDQKESAATSSLEDMRSEIEPKLRAQHADQRYNKWMAELRKRSRVRIFL